MKNLGITLIILVALSSGCSLDDKYHYNYSYRVFNQLQNNTSGYLISREIYGSDSLFFQLEPNGITEIDIRDGGDGPNETPIGTGNWHWEEVKLNLSDSVLNVDAKEDNWEYTTDKSVGIYTLYLTEELIQRGN